MPLLRTMTPLISAALLMSACSTADEAALAQADTALLGQASDGSVQPVAARAVLIAAGEGEGCTATSTPASGIAMRWTNDAASPIKAQVSGDLWSCEVAGAVTGVVFPAHGQSADECRVANAGRRPREYQGPCRWGWAASSELTAR